MQQPQKKQYSGVVNHEVVLAAQPLFLVLPWTCIMSYIELDQWFLIQILLAAFLSNAFPLMFYHVLINITLLLTLYLSLIYS